MTTTTYNKPASRQGSFVHEQVIAPDRGAACSIMNWHDHLVYNPETGDLIWKKRPVEHFVDERAWKIWNTRYSGFIAGNKRKDGYVIVNCNGVRNLAHRIIWEMHHGPIPKGKEIDHINTNSLDNRLQNMRLATHAQNQRNHKKPRTNTSGFKGVRPCKYSSVNPWQARIMLNSKEIHIGLFPTPEEAHEAYKAASLKYHGEFSRTE